jgi:hypothetical protein
MTAVSRFVPSKWVLLAAFFSYLVVAAVVFLTFVGILLFLGYSKAAAVNNSMFIGAVAGLLAALLVSRRLTPKGPKPGHCHKCDYDLTGNTSGRCPECGTPFDLKAPDRAEPRA